MAGQLGQRHAGAQPQRVPVAADGGQVGDGGQVDQVGRLAQAAPEIDQQIGPAGHEARTRRRSLEPHRFLQSGRAVTAEIGHEVHDCTPSLASSSSAMRSGVSGRASGRIPAAS